jgi:hypothetical protein
MNDSRCYGPEYQRAHVTSMVVHRYYRMVTVVTGDDVMSPKTIATKDYSSDGRFSDIIEKPL